MGNVDTRSGGTASGWNAFPVVGARTVIDAKGARVILADGSERLDFVMGWGSLLLGHRPTVIESALLDSISKMAVGFQYESEEGISVANVLSKLVPSARKVRFTCSGLEATMYACRVARSYTNRHLVVKFEGHFHGINDLLMFNNDASEAPGTELPMGDLALMPSSSGLPTNPELIVLPFNDVPALRKLFESRGSDIACVIVEPIALNLGCISPNPGFLEDLRSVTERAGSLLIFDEILTGFRVGISGAQGLFGIEPDLSCFGKAFGCGAALAAVAGRADVMDCFQPPGDVPMSGTNVGRRIAYIWAFAALKELSSPGIYARLESLNSYLVDSLQRVMYDAGIPAYVEGYGGRVGVFVGSDDRPQNMKQVCRLWDKKLHERIYSEIEKQQRLFGFFLPLRLGPEPITISLAHTNDDIDAAMEELKLAIVRSK